MKRIYAAIVLTLTLSPVAGERAFAQEPAPSVSNEKPMSFWMAQKVEHSKRILEALTKEDYAQVEAEANKLRTIGKIEGFVRRKDPVYRRHQRSFDSSLADIAAQAHAQNVEGATLAFNQLTSSCVMCHKMLRTVPVTAKSEVK